MNRKVVGRLLESFGCTVQAAVNGREALERLAGGATFDVVLMDAQMPEMDGYQATPAIRERLGNGAPPIVALTANALHGDRERCLAAGMTDYLSKPIRIDDLAAVLRRWAAPRPASGVDAIQEALDGAQRSAPELQGAGTGAGPR